MANLGRHWLFSRFLHKSFQICHPVSARGFTVLHAMLSQNNGEYLIVEGSPMSSVGVFTRLSVESRYIIRAQASEILRIYLENFKQIEK